MSLQLCVIIGAVIALAATILLYIFVFPEHRRRSLNQFLATVRSVLDTDYLLIEKIVKFIYVLETCAFIVIGVVMLACVEGGRWMGWMGLLLIVLGPIVARLLFEMFYMFVLLVKNTMDIKKYLYKEESGSAPIGDAPAPAPARRRSARASAAYTGYPDNYYQNTQPMGEQQRYQQAPVNQQAYQQAPVNQQAYQQAPVNQQQGYYYPYGDNQNR